LRARVARRSGDIVPTGTAVLLHPQARRPARRGLARRAARLAGALLLAAALVVVGTVAVAALLLALVVAAPLVAAGVAWLVWRSGDGAARETARIRSRLRRRARALGLVVLAGSQPALVRLAAAGVRDPGPARRAAP
jgi:hypothetical protein